MNEDFLMLKNIQQLSFNLQKSKPQIKVSLRTGNLTMKDQTHPVEVPFEFIEEIDGKASFKGSNGRFTKSIWGH
jgi:polyisoprenoid-binding protein YceI